MSSMKLYTIFFQILIYIIFFSIFISSCNNNSKEEISCNERPLSIKNNSYDNFKDIGLTPQKHPQGVGRDAVAYADFNQDGLIDIFTATLTYWPATTIEAATDSKFEFYIKSCSGEFEKK